MSYSGTMQVGKTVTLNVVLSETANRAQARQYTVSVYTIRDSNGVDLCEPKTVTMSPGASSISISFSFDLSVAEELTTYVRVSVPSSGSTLTSKTLSSVSIAKGIWTITVELKEDRAQLGKITLYDAFGVVLLTDMCLGKSESGDSMYVYYGNTPTGEYTGFLYTHNDSTYSYGDHQVINMTGKSGAIVESGRSGIWIHGGAPSTNSSLSHYPLRVTHGCVRVSNETQKKLQDIITDLVTNKYHQEVGTIIISESDD